MTGIEPASSVWKTEALPLSYIREVAPKLGNLTILWDKITKLSARLERTSGMWLNLVEHLFWVQGVAGSNPVIPTSNKNESGLRKTRALFLGEGS